jgi:hypothetical protein
MSLRFKTYEEISSKYPIDGIANVYSTVYEGRICCPKNSDLELAKEKHPIGYFDKDENFWYFYDIYNNLIYDHYCFNGEEWFLGKDDWEGIVEVTSFPVYGYNNFNRKRENFKTLEEAEEFIKHITSKEYRCSF